jgi:hypothetical protein
MATHQKRSGVLSAGASRIAQLPIVFGSMLFGAGGICTRVSALFEARGAIEGCTVEIGTSSSSAA